MMSKDKIAVQSDGGRQALMQTLSKVCAVTEDDTAARGLVVELISSAWAAMQGLFPEPAVLTACGDVRVRWLGRREVVLLIKSDGEASVQYAYSPGDKWIVVRASSLQLTKKLWWWLDSEAGGNSVHPSIVRPRG